MSKPNGKERPRNDERLTKVQAKNLLQEWREDYRLAKSRDRTGTEPQREPSNNPVQAKPEVTRRPKRVKAKGIDLRF